MTDRVCQPPALSMLVSEYKSDPKSDHLRLGQWFVNKYMPDSMDGRLYVENDTDKTLRMLSVYYELYQWES